MWFIFFPSMTIRVIVIAIRKLELSLELDHISIKLNFCLPFSVNFQNWCWGNIK